MKVFNHIWLCFFLCAGIACSAQQNTEPKKTKFEELDSLNEMEPRNALVFFHTKWCSFCQSMCSYVFQDKRVVQKLNEQFYFVPFDAEQQATINFRGKSYRFVPTGIDTGFHELAQEFGTVDNKITYPTICILGQDYRILFQYNQFLSVDDLLVVLDKL